MTKDLLPLLLKTIRNTNDQRILSDSHHIHMGKKSINRKEHSLDNDGSFNNVKADSTTSAIE